MSTHWSSPKPPTHEKLASRKRRSARGPLGAAQDNATVDWTKFRRAQPADYLLPLSLRWLESLAPSVRPLALATKYPRIVNRIASWWDEPAATRVSFDDLVYDRRGKRRGFPPDVYRDLVTLRDHYYGYGVERAR